MGVDGLECAGSHRLLGQNVQWIRGHEECLDLAGGHAFDRDGAMDEIGPVFRKEHAFRYFADLVAGAPDALQSAGDRGWSLHLYHQIDCAHVDTEFQAAGGDDAPQPAGLQIVLDEGALVLADAAVVGAGQEWIGSVVHLARAAEL